MSFFTRLLILGRNVVQNQDGSLDLIGVHWLRRVKVFPERAKLYLMIDVCVDKAAAKGTQQVTVVCKVPGETKPQELTATIDLGNPSGDTRLVQLPIPLDLTFTRAGTWRFGVWHDGVEWGHLHYLVVSEDRAVSAGMKLAIDELINSIGPKPTT